MFLVKPIEKAQIGVTLIYKYTTACVVRKYKIGMTSDHSLSNRQIFSPFGNGSVGVGRIGDKNDLVVTLYLFHKAKYIRLYMYSDFIADKLRIERIVVMRRFIHTGSTAFGLR